MTLEQAKLYAAKIVSWLDPYVKRAEVAGSVRRQRPVCNDIDIVCIPKMQMPSKDLLGDTDGAPVSLLNEFLFKYMQDSKGETWFRSSAGVPGFKETHLKSDAVNILMHLRKCDLDVFAATESSFTTRLITRTGSVKHNIWIAERAQRMGGAFQPQEGLYFGGGLVQARSEPEFYAALNLPFIEPQNREIEYLRTLETSYPTCAKS